MIELNIKKNNEEKLKFCNANNKLKKLEKRLNKKVITFSLPSGYACPGAKDCLSKADKNTGKIKDGPDTKFRCYQASLEGIYKSLREMVWKNFEALKKSNNMVKLINDSLPKNFDICRIHIGGDFFNKEYFDAWIEVAKQNPTKRFYAYTKMINLLVERLDKIPTNFSITCSRGSKHDELIDKFKLKCSEVVFSKKEAKLKKLPLDDDDYHAAIGNKSFALLLHGTMPKGSAAAIALAKINKQKKK